MAEPVSRSTAVLEVTGVQWATSKKRAEAVLSRRPGVFCGGCKSGGPNCHCHLRPFAYVGRRAGGLGA